MPPFLGDTGEVNRERAETHLRLVAEARLRDVMARAEPSSATDGQDQWAYTRLARVAQALSSVHAVDAGIAEEVPDDFELALNVRDPAGLSQVNPRRSGMRRLVRPSWRRPRPPVAAGNGPAAAVGAGSSVYVRTGAGTSTYSFTTIGAPAPSQLPAPAQPVSAPPPASAQPSVPSPSPPVRPAPWRLVPIGRVIPIDDGDARGELRLLVFAQTDAGARFIMTCWLDRPAGDGPRPTGGGPHRPPLPSQYLTAVDDQGTGYRFGFSGGGSSSDGHAHSEWEGALEVHPDPPDQIRWLDVTVPGASVTRIDLDPRIPVPEVSVIQQDLTPGELLLDRIAAGLLVRKPVFAPHKRRPLSETGLPGDVIAALQAAEALPPSSPVPGQLAWLSAKLAGDDVTAPPAGVPAPWLSLLAYHQRRPPRPAHAFRAAPVTVELPEIDGSRIAILGLFNGSDGTVAHLLATGVTPDEDWPDISGTGPMPTLWLRDHRDQWHTTRMNSFSSRDNDEVILRLAIEPPLDRDTPWLELRATGQQEQVCARLALRWA